MDSALGSDVTLYGNWRSSSTHRVAIALRLKGIPFRYVAVDLSHGAQNEASFRAVNPGAQVPVLVLDGETLTQSTAILEALDERFPNHPRLMPEGVLPRARAREIVQLVNSGMQPFQLPSSVRKRMTDAFGLDQHQDGPDRAYRAFTTEHLRATLAELDRLVARTGGPFALGDTPSIADCLIVPQLDASVPFGIDINGYPALSRTYEACAKIAAFQDSKSHTFPDAPARDATPSAGPGAGAAQSDSVRTAVAAVAELARVVADGMAYKEGDEATARYLADKANNPIPGIELARAEAFRRFGPVATKASSYEVCPFLRWLAEVMGARTVVEVGVFTGSSSLALLAGMPRDGRLTAFDVSHEYTDVARQGWASIGATERVDLRLVDAHEGLLAMQREPGRLRTVDLAYVDGLNTQYQANHEAILPLMRPGGVIVYDNVLWKGRVVAGDTDPQSTHLRELNAMLAVDPRVSSTVLSLGDGLALAVCHAAS